MQPQNNKKENPSQLMLRVGSTIWRSCFSFSFFFQIPPPYLSLKGHFRLFKIVTTFLVINRKYPFEKFSGQERELIMGRKPFSAVEKSPIVDRSGPATRLVWGNVVNIV